MWGALVSQVSMWGALAPRVTMWGALAPQVTMWGALAPQVSMRGEALPVTQTETLVSLITRENAPAMILIAWPALIAFSASALVFTSIRSVIVLFLSIPPSRRLSMAE